MVFEKRELALPKQMPWARGADGVEGPGSTPPLHLLHSLRADGRLERKESELPGLLLGPACTPSFSVGKGVGAFCELPCQRVGVRHSMSSEIVYLGLSHRRQEAATARMNFMI